MPCLKIGVTKGMQYALFSLTTFDKAKTCVCPTPTWTLSSSPRMSQRREKQGSAGHF